MAKLRLGVVAALTAAAVTGSAHAYEETDHLGPFRLDMPIAQWRALSAFQWGAPRSLGSAPGADIEFRSAGPMMFEGESWAVTVLFHDDGLASAALHRSLDLAYPACIKVYEALLAKLEKRYGPSNEAEGYRAGTVLDAPSDEAAVIQHHRHLQSTSTLYTKADVPTVLNAYFGFQAASVWESLAIQPGASGLRCTQLTVGIR